MWYYHYSLPNLWYHLVQTIQTRLYCVYVSDCHPTGSILIVWKWSKDGCSFPNGDHKFPYKGWRKCQLKCWLIGCQCTFGLCVKVNSGLLWVRYLPIPIYSSKTTKLMAKVHKERRMWRIFHRAFLEKALTWYLLRAKASTF